LSGVSPREANSISEPTTRSLTVPETSTSRAPASAFTRAAMWTFDEIRSEIDELIDVDAERVLSVQRVVGRFRNTGIPVDTPWASLFWVRGGKIARAVGYASKRRALRAAGLRE
jgi:ketosteroid isomerase-like protein